MASSALTPSRSGRYPGDALTLALLLANAVALALLVPLKMVGSTFIGLALVGTLVLLSPPVLVLAMLVVIQIGTATTWMSAGHIGPVQIFLSDVVLVAAVLRLVVFGTRTEAVESERSFSRQLMIVGLLIVCWTGISEINALVVLGPSYFAASLGTLLRTLGEPFLLLLAFSCGVRTPDEGRRLFRVAMILVAVQAAFGLFQFIAPAFGIGPGIVNAFSSTKFSNYYGSFAFRASGFIGSGRELAIMINIAMFGWLGFVMHGDRRRRRIALVIVCVLAAALLRTLSKFEYVALAASFFVYAFAARRAKPIVLGLMLVSGGMFVMPRNAVEGFRVELAPTVTERPEDTSLGSRIIIWKLRMIPLIKERPLVGHGWGVEAYDTRGLAELRGAPHNQYLQWAAAIGLVGLALFLALLLMIGRRAYRLWKEAHDTTVKALGLCVFGAVLTMSFSALYSDVFSPGTGSVRLFWVLVGMLHGTLVVGGATSLVTTEPFKDLKE